MTKRRRLDARRTVGGTDTGGLVWAEAARPAQVRSSGTRKITVVCPGEIGLRTCSLRTIIVRVGGAWTGRKRLEGCGIGSIWTRSSGTGRSGTGRSGTGCVGTHYLQPRMLVRSSLRPVSVWCLFSSLFGSGWTASGGPAALGARVELRLAWLLARTCSVLRTDGLRRVRLPMIWQSLSITGCRLQRLRIVVKVRVLDGAAWR